MPRRKPSRFVHPEQLDGEVFGGNVWARDFPAIGWRTKRLATKGYFSDGKQRGKRLSGSMRSWFVTRAEVEATGTPIPDRGPLDHRWGSVQDRAERRACHD